MNIVDLYVDIGRNIKAARQISKLSQAELAEKLNLKRTSVTNIENGKQRLPLHLLYEICNLLNMDITKILPNNKNSKKEMTVSIEGKTFNITEDSLEKINKYLPKAKLESTLQ